jgi:hypothetical protein
MQFFYEKHAWKNFRIWPYAIKYFFFLKMFWIFFWNIFDETEYFNTGFVFYSINIQPDIMQNW